MGRGDAVRDAMAKEIRTLREENATLKKRIAVGVDFLEERFGNTLGNDWEDEAAGRVADTLGGWVEP